jgi:hypothetical protein
MLKYFSFLFCTTFLLFACQQKADSEKAKQFAALVHTATTGSIRATQQAFIDKMTETLTTIKQDRSAIIDTKRLRELLNKAKEASNKSFVELSNITEVDNTINLKEKALAEIESNQSLYEHEFTSIVDALESNASDKMATLDKLIVAFSAKEDAIKTARRNANEASYDFEKKYNINMPASD